ncbi:N-acetylgalactosamine kinase, variant 3 [Schistosoma haematobium]|uniref:N-acetylgalactosamine kinase, variant 3 n=1 Tax=Schistosoma haematobium TaxID=6185 RepID=A0A922LPJ5_SCHHA|nr:N-acetylgalactosamine kinase, variant 3 [Schistosoma haematobium]KAH9590755.1 N-acetylgalactosamine kinase, variant 3 [Schistosoma haematobium]
MGKYRTRTNTRKLETQVYRNRISGRYNQNKEVNNERLRVNNNQSRPRSTGQAMSQIWINSNTSLLPEFYAADDVVQNNDESSTTKPSSSENITPSKPST